MRRTKLVGRPNWRHDGVSLPFEAGDHRRVAAKIVDDRGIESLTIVGLNR